MLSELDKQATAAKVKIRAHIFWGDAVWTRTQFLGEIARGDWGLCHLNEQDIFPPDKSYNSQWYRIECDQRPIAAQDNEFKDYHEREREEMKAMSSRNVPITETERELAKYKKNVRKNKRKMNVKKKNL
eukprot:UN22448